MSVVVAVKDKGKIWLACDSQITKGYRKIKGNESANKIFKHPTNENCIIGFVGSVRDMNIIKYIISLDDNEIKLNGITIEYLVKKFIPYLFDILKQNGRLRCKDNIFSWDSEIIISYKEKAFLIESDGCVIEVEDFEAIGSGEKYAYGYNTESLNLNKKELALYAVKAACNNDIHVGYPILIGNTIDLKIEKIEKIEEK